MEYRLWRLVPAIQLSVIIHIKVLTILIDINKIKSQSVVSENRVVQLEPRTEVLSAWYD